MKVLLFLAKGFETMEASVFTDIFGWASTSYGHDVEVVTGGVKETVVSEFGVPVKVDVLLKDVNTDKYDALAVPGCFEEFGFYSVKRPQLILRSFLYLKSKAHSSSVPVSSAQRADNSLAYSNGSSP